MTRYLISSARDDHTWLGSSPSFVCRGACHMEDRDRSKWLVLAHIDHHHAKGQRQHCAESELCKVAWSTHNCHSSDFLPLRCSFPKAALSRKRFISKRRRTAQRTLLPFVISDPTTAASPKQSLVVTVENDRGTLITLKSACLSNSYLVKLRSIFGRFPRAYECFGNGL